MATKKKKVAADVEEALADATFIADDTPAEKMPVVEATSSQAVKVYSRAGAYVRTYSKEDHGADYRKLAKGYADKIAGSVR